MEEKYARMKKGVSNPFIDPDGYKSYVEEREQAFHTELTKQKGVSR
jgi:metallo-beta-lactamase class B